MRLTILSAEEPEEELQRAEAALVAAGLVKPADPTGEGRELARMALEPVSQERRAELARLYAAGGPLSEVIIAERNGR